MTTRGIVGTPGECGPASFGSQGSLAPLPHFRPDGLVDLMPLSMLGWRRDSEKRTPCRTDEHPQKIVAYTHSTRPHFVLVNLYRQIVERTTSRREKSRIRCHTLAYTRSKAMAITIQEQQFKVTM